jgi:hypothetical protein
LQFHEAGFLGFGERLQLVGFFFDALQQFSVG